MCRRRELVWQFALCAADRKLSCFFLPQAAAVVLAHGGSSAADWKSHSKASDEAMPLGEGERTADPGRAAEEEAQVSVFAARSP